MIPEVPCSREIEITSVTCKDQNGHPTSVIRTGDAVRVRIEYVARRPVSDAMFELYVYSMLGGLYGPWCHLTTAADESEPMSVVRGEGFVECEIDELSLLPGPCYVSARVAYRNQPPGLAIDWQQECLTLRVDPGKAVRGTFYMPHRWLVGGAAFPAGGRSNRQLASCSAES